MDGRRQYPSFLEYAVKHGLVEEGSDVSTTLILMTRYFIYVYGTCVGLEARQGVNGSMYAGDEQVHRHGTCQS